MELSRRDLLAALSAVGVGSVTGCSALSEETDPVTAHDADTLVALARVVYPSEIEGVEAFVRDYSLERVNRDEDYARGVHDAVATLDEYARTWGDHEFVALSPEDQSTLLDVMGVDTASPDPDGTAQSRVRYYLANELLYAFYTTPTGADLAGLENPPGHPGGVQSYQRGPNQ